MRLPSAVAGALRLVGSVSSARADIVNVQSVLSTDAPEGLSGSLSGSADWRTGNTRLVLLSASPTARYRLGRHRIIGIVRAAFGKSGDTDIAKKTFEHLRYRYQVSSRVTGEAFVQHAYDQFRRIQLRALIGVGPKIDLLRGEAGELSVGVAYLLELERLNDAGQADDGAEDLQHRASVYVTGRYRLDSRIDLVQTVYVQPRLDAPSDARLLSESELVIKLGETLSLTNALGVAWDAEPPEGVEALDTQLKTSITYSFSAG